MTQFIAVAGNYVISVTGGKESDVTSLIDAALDDKIKRQQLPKGVVAQFHMNLLDFADAVAGGLVALDGMPGTIDMTCSQRGKNLSIQITIE